MHAFSEMINKTALKRKPINLGTVSLIISETSMKLPSNTEILG